MRRVLAMTFGLALLAGPAQALPTIMRGTPVPGDPHTAQLIIMGSANYESCSAAVWKPRILLTAAHCLTDAGGSAPVTASRIFVMPPGGSSPQVFPSGPVGPARVHVTGIWLGQAYVEASHLVAGNDIAVITLDSDLAGSPFTRLADRTELQAWAQAQRETSIVGYGITSLTDQGPSLPRSGAFQFTELQTDRRATDGWVLWSNPVGQTDTCPGDSGAPQFLATPTSTLLMGDVAGGNCIGQPHTAQGFAAISYLEILNPALASVGYPTIPSAPTQVSATTLGNSQTVWWSPPASSPETALTYEVRDGQGAVVCTAVAAMSCTLPATSSLTVRSVNAQGEGDAVAVPAPREIRPAAPGVQAKGERVVISVRELDYPVVTGYRAISQSGKVACRIPDPAQSRTCATRLPAGTYRFRVSATTPQGRTLESAPSRQVHVH